MVTASPGAGAGRTVRVWVDADGRLTGPPRQPSQVRGQVAMAMLIAPIGVCLVLLCAGQLAHSVLGRCRLAAWDADWRATEPQWTWRH
jgi:hypothetical protein